MTRPHPDPDRRSFLRTAFAGAVPIAALAAWACGRQADGADPEGGRAEASGPTAAQRHRVRAWGGDAVFASAPTAEPPAAYVSRGLQRVFVDRTLRDGAALVLGAHISVSTGLWRIPLPGDPPRTPLQPGDAIREFEEHPLEAWDPETPPVEGDARVLVGRAEVVTIELVCEVVDGTDGRCSGGPWAVPRCTPGGDRPCREILGEVGAARLWADGRCAETPRPVRCLTWVASLTP